MPDPYNLSAGRMIGTPYYSPRTSSALRRLAPVGDAELYGDDEEDAWLAREYLAANPNLTKATTRTARGSATIGGKTYFMGPGGSATEVQDLSGGNDPAAVQAWASKNAPAYTWQDKPRYQAGKLMQSPGMMEWLKQRGDDRRFEQEMKREDVRGQRRRADMEFEYGLRERSPEGRRMGAEATLFQKQAEAAAKALERAGTRSEVSPAILETDATLAASPYAMEVYRSKASMMDAPQALAETKIEVRKEADQANARLAALAEAAKTDRRAAQQFAVEKNAAEAKYGKLISTPSFEVRTTIGAILTSNPDMRQRVAEARKLMSNYRASAKARAGSVFNWDYEKKSESDAYDQAVSEVSDIAAEIADMSGMDEHEVYNLLVSRTGGGIEMQRPPSFRGQ